MFRRGKKKKEQDRDAAAKRKATDELDAQIERLMEQLNIPASGRQAILLMDDGQKQMMVKQYRAKVKLENVSRR